ncbi:class I adenylate-forming enzyme family protein [Pandoraea sp. NPDC087047]|uniref:class I adenylate-forming enzyme family protein n=1 Tax=Pandoraea sp. NPDC087047 TaxID=3364390 RepID=UPI0038275DF6
MKHASEAVVAPRVGATHFSRALEQNAIASASVPALIFGEQVWDHARLGSEVWRLARGLAARGIQPGDRIAMQLGNSAAGVVTVAAAMCLGAIVAPINTSYTANETRRTVERLQPSLFLFHIENYALTARALDGLLPPAQWFSVGEHDAPCEVDDWTVLQSEDDTPFVADTLTDDMPLVIMATSGTTAEPKLVVHTQRTLGAMVTPRSSAPDDWIELVPTPIFCMTSVLAIVQCIHLGRTIALPECAAFDANVFLDAIERHRCTRLGCSPYGLAELTRAQRARKRDVSSLRTCTVSGDACAPVLIDNFQQVFGWKPQPVFGTTETSMCVGPGSQFGTYRADPARARLVDSEGGSVVPGAIGELQVRGDNIFKGYWVSPGVIHDPKVDGWYRTGDLMRLEKDGDLRYVARTKNIIVRAGRNIAPAEIERVLLSDAHVREAAVFGLPDVEFGERVAALVVRNGAGESCTEAALRAQLEAQLAGYKIPEHLFFVESIPRNVWGKIDRKSLAAVAAQLMQASASTGHTS